MCPKEMKKATDNGKSADQQDAIQRNVLPIPDVTPIGLTTFDAKDPDTKFPPIRQLRPPKGAPNVLVVLIDDAGFGSSSAFGGPCHTPNFEKLGANGLKYTRFHTTALCSAYARRAGSVRPEPSHRRHGARSLNLQLPHRVRNSMKPEHLCGPGRNAEAQRLLHGTVWQVSRSPGVGDQRDWSWFDHWPTGERRLPVFLWLRRRRNQSVLSRIVRRHHAG